MRTALLLLGLAVGTVLLTAGCQTSAGPRVVRLARVDNSPDWQLSVNGAPRRLLSSDDLTTKLPQLALKQGDLVLLGAEPGLSDSPAADLWSWTKAYCDSNQVAVYLYGASARNPGGDMFSIPVYHWTAPFEDPRNLAAAAFFREGKFLGRGSNGFESMLRELVSTRPKKVFVLGSLYDLGRDFGPLERPYESRQELLDAALAKAGTELVLLDPAP